MPPPRCPLLSCLCFGAGVRRPSQCTSDFSQPALARAPPHSTIAPGYHHPHPHFSASTPGWLELLQVQEGPGGGTWGAQGTGGTGQTQSPEENRALVWSPGQNQAKGLRRSSPEGFLEEGASWSARGRSGRDWHGQGTEVQKSRAGTEVGGGADLPTVRVGQAQDGAPGPHLRRAGGGRRGSAQVHAPVAAPRSDKAPASKKHGLWPHRLPACLPP